MKVRLRDDVANEPAVRGWLRPNRDYVVLAVEYQGIQASYRIVAENETPALFEAGLFTVVDASVDPGWIVRHSTSGVAELIPIEWSKPGFWEDFFNGEAEADALYNGVLKRMTRKLT